MSKDSVDMLKAVASTIALFAAGACIMLFVLLGLRTYGQAIPFFGDLPRYQPPDTLQLLATTRPFVVTGGAWLVAAGVALALRSAYLDHMLQIFAKAVVLVAAANIGVIAGHWAFLRITSSGDYPLQNLTRLAIVLAVLVAVALLLRLESLRGAPLTRYGVALALILAGPVITVLVR